ncbi:MAG: sulfatase-like hydrolase/transferase [Tannerella sp.]|jgi:arylsulfatase|nr:sulfatase-like hydrolase/transferase [Tannerella sp.]
MKSIINSKNLGLVSSVLLLGGSAAAQYSPTPAFKGEIGKTLADTKESLPKTQPVAQDGAPNVVWVLIDDIGYGAASAFGGLIETPTLDRLANQGLRFTNWHTCAFSAPTRAALLTGRNQHSVHFGYFANSSYGTPGYDGYLPFEKATIAEILRENGYNTFCIGKYHLTHSADASQAGPFNRWPTGRGFDHYFGYSPDSGADDQWHPTLYRDTQREPEDPQGRHVNELFANEAIRYIADQKSAAPGKPFFLYFSTGSGHAPHHVAKEWIDKYKGKFAKGWDWYREETLARQKQLGVVPANTPLAPRNPEVKPWDELTPDEKNLFTRHIETYAGFISQTDYEIGRVIRFIEEIGQLDNTLIAVMIGDNGAEGSGKALGRFLSNAQDATREQIVGKAVKNLDLLGSEYSFPNYPDGWAAAANTPFRYYKGYATYEGGTHDPLILFYPKKIRDKGGIRHQYSYVSDILPTTVELAGARIPTVINGYPQEPVEGVSLAYAIVPENRNLPERHTVQYHEMVGSYAIYKDGWKASLPSRIDRYDRLPQEEKKWHLYHVSEDFNELNDLADKYPDKVKELIDAFDGEAWKYNVYPLKEQWETKNWSIHDNDQQVTIYTSGRPYAEVNGFRFQTGSYAITAYVEIPETGAEGVLFSSGNGTTSGVSLYVKNKKPVFAYNSEGQLIELISGKTLPAGNVTVKAEVIYGSGNRANKTVTLYVNGEKVGTKELGRIANAGSNLLQAGRNFGTPVSTAYKSPYIFTGNLKKVVVDRL